MTAATAATAALPVVLVSGASLGTGPFRHLLHSCRGEIFYLGETDGTEAADDQVDLSDRLVVETGETAGERLAAALLDSPEWRRNLGRLISVGRAEVFVGGSEEFCQRLRSALAACAPDDFWPSQDVWQPAEAECDDDDLNDLEDNEGFDEVVLEETYRFESETQLEPGGQAQFRCSSRLSSTTADLPDFNFDLVDQPRSVSPARTASLLSLDAGGDWWRRRSRLPSSAGFDSGLNSPADSSDLHRLQLQTDVEPVVTRHVKQSTYCGPDKTTFTLEETVRLTFRRNRRPSSNASLPPSPYWSCRGSRNFLNSTTSLGSPSRSRRESETAASLYCPLSPNLFSRLSPRRQLWSPAQQHSTSDDFSSTG